jgi:hypothetical protein
MDYYRTKEEFFLQLTASVDSISFEDVFHSTVTLFSTRSLLMQIIAQCPSCGSKWLLEAREADKRIRCSKCRLLFKIPNLDKLPRAVKVINQAKGTIYVDENGKTYG